MDSSALQIHYYLFVCCISVTFLPLVQREMDRETERKKGREKGDSGGGGRENDSVSLLLHISTDTVRGPYAFLC